MVTGWVDMDVIWGKHRSVWDQQYTQDAIGGIPVPLLNLDSDNRSEFIRLIGLYTYCQENGITVIQDQPPTVMN